MNPINETPMPDDDEIDLLELWDILVSRWLWIAAVTCLSAVSAIAVALWMPPIYRAEVVMISSDDAGGKGGLSGLTSQFGGLAELAGVSLGSSSGKAEAVALLKSRALLESFIRENQLMPILFAEQWDSAGKQWQVADAKAVPTLEDAWEKFKTIVAVEEDKKSGVLKLAVEWTDRELAAQWANDLVRRANETMRTRAINEAQGSVDYLNKELQKTSVVEIQQAIYRLLEANYKTISIASAREQYAFKVIDPAVAADPKRKVRPKRAQIVILATLAGGFIGVLGVFLHRGLQNMRARRTTSPPVAGRPERQEPRA
ncbi:MAG: hypothetical protein FJ189_01945 [Gammaproteobacteria bacterium]|nr:hypothetical protein [Gammaproteobacteria bacterium]